MNSICQSSQAHQRKWQRRSLRSEMRLAACGSLGPRGSFGAHGSAHGIKSGLDLGAHHCNQRKRKRNCQNLPHGECTRRACESTSDLLYMLYGAVLLDGNFPNDRGILFLQLAASKRGGYLNWVDSGSRLGKLVQSPSLLGKRVKVPVCCGPP